MLRKLQLLYNMQNMHQILLAVKYRCLYYKIKDLLYNLYNNIMLLCYIIL